ncbi:hypothetical protein D3C81_1654620 [compost metagenome]
MEIAKQPRERKLWAARKLYGNLPPTDPRFLSLTMVQIDLDLVHHHIDQMEKNGNSEVYVDGGYEDYDKEAAVEDEQLSSYSVPVHKKGEIPTSTVLPSGEPETLPDSYPEEDWEEVDD